MRAHEKKHESWRKITKWGKTLVFVIKQMTQIFKISYVELSFQSLSMISPVKLLAGQFASSYQLHAIRIDGMISRLTIYLIRKQLYWRHHQEQLQWDKLMVCKKYSQGNLIKKQYSNGLKLFRAFSPVLSIVSFLHPCWMILRSSRFVLKLHKLLWHIGINFSGLDVTLTTWNVPCTTKIFLP